MQSLFRPSRLVPAGLVLALCSTGPEGFAQGLPAPSGAASAATAPKSSLPTEALQKAREAEQHLAANQPDKAISILKTIDKQHPGNPAISLRLAEIHDTNNQYGAALFYYRRYIHTAGSRAREVAAARVSTLELMVGIDAEAEKVAKELGEPTRPVATPVSKVERVIAAEAKDGSRVPLRSAEDVERIERQGYVQPLPKTAATPELTPAHQPIIIPDQLSRSVPAPITGSQETMPVSGASPVTPVPRAARPKVSLAPTATPKPDADALLAQAFVKADDPQVITEPTKTPEAPPVQTPEPKLTATPDREQQAPPPLELLPQSTITPAKTPRPPVTVRATIATGAVTPSIAYTRPNSSSESPRAETFFNVSNVGGPQARVSVVNNLDAGVVTVSIVPMDDGEVLSAILMPGESKTLFVKPARYNISANASTTDYSPITLMNTQFEYKFDGGRQYTRRFTQSNLQQLN